MLRAMVAFVIVTGSLVAAPRAGATIDCDAGFVCFWPGVGGTGTPQVDIDDRHRISNKLARLMNNDASSMENDTEFAVFVYAQRDGKGERICVPPTGTLIDLASLSFDDRASSSKVKRHATCPT